MRTTRQDCENALDRMIRSSNGAYRRAESWDDVGGLRIDYNPTYGGVNVELIVNEQGGVRHPFTAYRMAPAEFVRACNFAADALYGVGTRIPA